MGTYYRTRPTMSFGGMGFPPAVKALLIINAVLFVVPAMVSPEVPLYRTIYAALVPNQFLHGMVWQIATYMFFHANFMHFLFNMLTLWMFGSAVEQTWGTRRFAIYYLSCGVAAGVCVVLAAILFSGNSMITATIGSSGAIYGLILAFGMLFPEAPVWFMFFFQLPAKYFAVLMAFIEFFMQSTQPGSGVSHVAHLGGMLFGYIFIKRISKQRRGFATPYAHRPPTRSGGFFSRFDLKGRYNRWKLNRARKKFEVYMRQADRDRDRWTN